MKTICAWCGAEMRDGETADGRISHGLCPRCETSIAVTSWIESLRLLLPDAPHTVLAALAEIDWDLMDEEEQSARAGLRLAAETEIEMRRRMAAGRRRRWTRRRSRRSCCDRPRPKQEPLPGHPCHVLGVHGGYVSRWRLRRAGMSAL